MVALLTDSFGLKSSKLAQLDSTKFDEEPFCARNARKRGSRRPKAHKNPDFVLGKTGIGTRERGN